MQLIACSVLLLVILGECYCNSTTTVNKTSSSWGYDYSYTDTNAFKVNHDHTGYRFDPIYNNPSSTLKKHQNSSSVYNHFTSPGTNMSISQSNVTIDVINLPNGNIYSRANSTVPHKNLLESSANEEQTRKFRTLPSVKTQTFTVTETRAPTGPTYYPQATTYGQTYAPVGGSMYGIPNGQKYVPPTGPLYGSTYGQQTGQMNGYAPYGYGTQTGATYGPQNTQMYRPQNGQTYGPQNGQTYGLQNGQTYGLQNGQTYGLQNGQTYGPQNGQTYGPQNGQTHGPETGHGYPTGSYGSYRNY